MNAELTPINEPVFDAESTCCESEVIHGPAGFYCAGCGRPLREADPYA